MAYYVDTSAFVKLVVRERGSARFRRWAVVHDGELVASDLLRTEAIRAARRHSPQALAATRVALEAITLVTITRGVCELAANLDTAILRSLDALHVASALILGDEMQGIATYDAGMMEAARLCGLPLVAP